jgi:hypothetical protein
MYPLRRGLGLIGNPELTTRVPKRRGLGRIAAGAALLLLAGITQAAAQFVAPGGTAQRAQEFPPPPGQPREFPPPPGGQAAAFPPPPGQARDFPAPGSQPQAFPAPGAQTGAFAPSRGTGSGGSFVASPGAGGGMGAPPQMPQVCMQFQTLGKEMEESLQAVNEAGRKKLSREQACPLFKTLSARETKALKFLETNKQTCQIPSNFIKQLAERHSHIVKVTKVVCTAGPPAGGGAPSLSDALGGPTIADDSSARPGRGTFDTLTGNALQRN